MVDQTCAPRALWDLRLATAGAAVRKSTAGKLGSIMSMVNSAATEMLDDESLQSLALSD
jgi:hypothetical protein